MRKTLAIALLVTLSSLAAADDDEVPLPDAKEFSKLVLEVAKTYPTDGTHKYYWPKTGTWPGTTRDLFYQGTKVCEGDAEKRCFCCGITFEVFFRAYQQYCERARKPFKILDLNATGVDNLRKEWFGPTAKDRTTLLKAITRFGLGEQVKLEDARPGDFCQLWRHSGSGHSVIVLALEKDAKGAPVSLRYWSSQGSTNGIAEHTETFLDEKAGVIASETYVARIGTQEKPEAARNADAFLKTATTKLREKDWDGAIKDASEAIRLRPEDPRAHNLRGAAKYFKRDHEAAVADLDEAIRLEPTFAEAYYNRALARNAKGERDRALLDLGEAIRLRPKYPAAFVNRGLMTEETGDHDGAIADYSEAIRLQPNYPEAFYDRGVAKDSKGDHDGAIADHTEAIRLRPDYAAAFVNRGLSKAAKGDHEGAFADLDEGIRLRPKAAGPYAARGRIKASTGDKAAALADLTKAAELDPKDPYTAIWIAGLGGDRAPLEKLASGKDWISNVVRLCLGKTTREELLAEAARAPNERERKERLCEAHGYLGLLADRDGDPATAKKDYEACVATGVLNFIEYAWAKARLPQLSK